MSDHTPTSPGTDIVPRTDPSAGITRQLITAHERFAPQPPAYDGRWTSHASQRDVRDVAVDRRRGWLWMATWGGVLCWKPGEHVCVRFTSAHGLLGNATRCLAVDDQGLVWAGAQELGLCQLSPDEGTPWQPQPRLAVYTVLCLAPRPGGGIYAALRDANGAGTLAEMIPPYYRPVLHRGALATREIGALLVDDDETLWIGNAWGLHRLVAGVGPAPLESVAPGHQVHALGATGGVLWLGTNQGIYALPPKGEPYRNRDWPYDDVVSLATEPETGDKWIATARESGRIVDGAWRPLRCAPPGAARKLLVARPYGYPLPAPPPPPPGGRREDLFRPRQAWMATANGVYRLGAEECVPAFAQDAEDGLSNGVQCLWAEADGVWMGTVRDLYHWNGVAWRRYDDEAQPLPDVRAIAGNPGSADLAVGSWPAGVHRLSSGVHLPHLTRPLPVIALAGGNGCLWAATTDEVASLVAGQDEWQKATPSARAALGPAVIQALCATDDALWVGTSAGLWRYRLGLWHPPADPAASIQALARDPTSGQVWVGAQTGLYRADNWRRYHEGDVRALAFCPDGMLWVGLTTGLELWPAMPAAGPAERWGVSNSGLAANIVTALAVRDAGGQREVWAGSPAGVSCYRYTS